MGGIEVKVPYLRQTPSGFYWEPSRKVKALGFSAMPLGKDPAAAIAEAKRWNEKVAAEIKGVADATPPAPREGTLAWVIAEYQQSPEWAALAPATQRGYRQALKRIEEWGGAEHVSAITRRAVKVWYRAMRRQTPAFAGAIIRALRVVLHFARDEGFEIARLDKLKLHTAVGDGEPWEDWEISAYLDEARRQGRQSMALALMLGVSLGQREGDVLRLPRSAYDPATGAVTLKQHKTKTPLAVPALPELRREIAMTPARGTIFVVSEKSGKPYKPRYFARLHRDICRAAGIPDKRWFMHLRHTAATRLGEAGCGDDLIRAVTGHKSRAVVARYVKPNDTMSKAAIARLQDHRGKAR
jgi:integrase